MLYMVEIKRNIICQTNQGSMPYGTLLGAILFYEKLSKQLVDWGYEPKCYDRCTFNKMDDGNQITIQFHVWVT